MITYIHIAFSTNSRAFAPKSPTAAATPMSCAAFTDQS